MENLTALLNDTLTEMLSAGGGFNTTTEMPVKPTTEYRNRVPLDNTFVFTKVYSWMCYGVGIPGNFITLIILARMRPINSVQVWLMGLTFMDWFTLSIRFSIVPFESYQLINRNYHICMLEFITVMTCEYCNYIFFLAMTTERFFAVWFPLKMSSWTSPKKAVIGVVSVLVVITLLQFHYIWTMGYYVRGCYTHRHLADFWDTVWINTVESILFRAIPLFGVFLLNVMILVKLRMNKDIKKAMSEGQAKEKKRQQSQVDRLLTVATVFMFVSLFPDIIYRFSWKTWGDPYKNWYVLRDIVIVMNVVAVLRLGNHAGNFLCYIVAARKFRNELIYLLTCGRYGEHNGVKGKMVQKK